MNRYTRENDERIVGWELAQELHNEGIDAPAELYYKIETPTGEHKPDFDRETILRAWGTKDVPMDEFIPAPTRRELEDFIDITGLIVSDELLEKINNI